MTSTVGAKGQVVVPKKLRDLVSLQPGDQVDFELRDDVIVLVPSVGRADSAGDIRAAR